MTGALARLRSWLGSLFGDGGDPADEVTGSDADEAGRRVAHRDDRPLETPATADVGARPPAVGQSDDEDGGDDRDRATADRRRVSIPDADAVAGGRPADHSPTPRDATDGDDAVAGSDDDATGEDADVAAAEGEVDASGEGVDVGAAEGKVDASADGAYACSVCGTPVDGSDGPCPLCGSRDAVHAGESSPAAEGATGRGRTAVSRAGEEDEAVDRLRDVRRGGD